LTAASRPEERVCGLEAGAIDYVVKPFDLDEIRLRLMVHIRANRYRATQAVGALSTDATADPAAGPLDTRLFSTARDLLLTRLNETPELATLAGSVGTNPHRLNLAFRLCAGVTVFDFLYQERMKRASRLLCETTMDVQSIAEVVGYGSGRNFATAFRKYFGHSPSEVRQQRATN
ncbi:MAG TPA: DNA-binding response regulator, partial [Paraburkholderia sp.]